MCNFLRDCYIPVLGAGNSIKSKTGQDTCLLGIYHPIGWWCCEKQRSSEGTRRCCLVDGGLFCLEVWLCFVLEDWPLMMVVWGIVLSIWSLLVMFLINDILGPNWNLLLDKVTWMIHPKLLGNVRKTSSWAAVTSSSQCSRIPISDLWGQTPWTVVTSSLPVSAVVHGEHLSRWLPWAEVSSQDDDIFAGIELAPHTKSLDLKWKALRGKVCTSLF